MTPTNSGHFEWFLVFNPTVANLSFGDETNSTVQTSVGQSSDPSTSTVTGGTIITGGFVIAGSGASKGGVTTGSLKNALRLGADISANVDKIVLAIRPVAGGTNIDVEGSLTWRELK